MANCFSISGLAEKSAADYASFGLQFAELAKTITKKGAQAAMIIKGCLKKLNAAITLMTSDHEVCGALQAAEAAKMLHGKTCLIWSGIVHQTIQIIHPSIRLMLDGENIIAKQRRHTFAMLPELPQLCYAVLQALGPIAEISEDSNGAAEVYLIMKATDAAAKILTSHPPPASALISNSAAAKQSLNQDAGNASPTSHSAMQQNATCMLEAGLQCIHALQQRSELPSRLQQGIFDYVAALLPRLGQLPKPPHALASKVCMSHYLLSCRLLSYRQSH